MKLKQQNTRTKEISEVWIDLDGIYRVWINKHNFKDKNKFNIQEAKKSYLNFLEKYINEYTKDKYILVDNQESRIFEKVRGIDFPSTEDKLQLEAKEHYNKTAFDS